MFFLRNTNLNARVREYSYGILFLGTIHVIPESPGFHSGRISFHLHTFLCIICLHDTKMTLCSHTSRSRTSSFCMVFNPHEILILVRNSILLSCKLSEKDLCSGMKNHKSSSLEQVAHAYLIWHKNHLSKNALGWDGQFYHVNAVWASLWNETKFRNESHSGIKINQGQPRGVVVYQYTRKKFAKIPKNTQNSSK